MSNNKWNIALLIRHALGRARARGVAGFTLTEVLATMLIMVMVTTMVATGIPAAQQAYLKTVNASNAQSALSTTLAAMRNELGMASEVRIVDGENGKEIFYIGAEGCWTSISNNSGDTEETSGLEKRYYKGTAFDNLELDESDGKQNTGIYDLVPDKSITNELRVEFSNPTFDPDKRIVTIEKVVVLDKLNQELAKVDNYQIRVRG